MSQICGVRIVCELSQTVLPAACLYLRGDQVTVWKCSERGARAPLPAA
jgi:hypothetical protein